MKYYIGNNIIEYDNYKNVTIEDCYNYCKDKKILGLDIETSRNIKKNLYDETKFSPGLDPWLSRICMLQIGDLDNQFVIDTRVINIYILKEILESKEILKVGHNLSFEFKHLYINKGIQLCNVWDTMICDKILYNGMRISYSLENLAYRYLNAEKVIKNPSLFLEDSEFEYIKDDVDYELDLIDSIESSTKFKIDKSIRLDFVEIGDKPFTQSQLNYATDDILMPLLIKQIQEKGRRISEDDFYCPELGFKLENAFSLVAAKIELKGLRVDSENWLKLYDENLKKRYEVKKVLNDFVIANYSKFANQMNLFSPEPSCRIEWESSKQVVEFFKYLGFCPREFSKQTGKVEDTVGAKVLYTLLTNENKDNFIFNKLPETILKDDNNQSLILTYLIYKKYQLLTTTFGKDWLLNIHPVTKRIHTRFNTLLNTGRMASFNVNLQQLPKGEEWRKLFIADPLKSLVSVDYDTQEVKVAALVHNEPLLQDFFIKEHPIFKKDFHTFTASKLFSKLRNIPDLVLNKKEHGKERNIAKTTTFRIFYGASGYTLGKDMGTTAEEGEQFIEAYLEAFPGLKQAFQNAKEQAVKNGWVYNCIFTQKRYFDPEYPLYKEKMKKYWSYFPKDYKKMNQKQRDSFKKQMYEEHPEAKTLIREAGKLRSSLERKSLNFPIQGSSATMTKLAIMEIEKNNYDLSSGVMLPVHDELVTQFDENIGDEMNIFVMKAMEKAGTFFSKTVVMSATGEVGKYWIH